MMVNGPRGVAYDRTLKCTEATPQGKCRTRADKLPSSEC